MAYRSARAQIPIHLRSEFSGAPLAVQWCTRLCGLCSLLHFCIFNPMSNHVCKCLSLRPYVRPCVRACVCPSICAVPSTPFRMSKILSDDSICFSSRRASSSMKNGVENQGQNCWGECGRKQGACAWCGTGMCCRKGWWDTSGGCDGSLGIDLPRHVCVPSPSSDALASCGARGYFGQDGGALLMPRQDALDRYILVGIIRAGWGGTFLLTRAASDCGDEAAAGIGGWVNSDREGDREGNREGAGGKGSRAIAQGLITFCSHYSAATRPSLGPIQPLNEMIDSAPCDALRTVCRRDQA